MSVRTRTAALVTGLALVAGPALALAGPASASGGGGGHGGGHGGGGGGINCVTTATTYQGITKHQTFAAGVAGTVVLKRDDVNDGLIVGRTTANAGWHVSGKIKTGPKVGVDFDSATQTIQLEAAQSAQYYGPDVLVIEIKTCDRS